MPGYKHTATYYNFCRKVFTYIHVAHMGGSLVSQQSR